MEWIVFLKLWPPMKLDLISVTQQHLLPESKVSWSMNTKSSKVSKSFDDDGGLLGKTARCFSWLFQLFTFRDCASWQVPGAMDIVDNKIWCWNYPCFMLVPILFHEFIQ